MRLMIDRPRLDVVEALAALSHEQWAGWARWMIDQWSPEAVARWERQVATPYAELSEREKESDRVEARRILDLLAGLPTTERP